MVSANKPGNLNLTVNDCYVKLKLGSLGNFISVAQNDKSVNVHFKDSSFVGNLKSKNRRELTFLMGQESNLIQLDNSSFEHAYINIFDSSHVRIEDCVFINTVIHVFRANYLRIADSIFKNYFESSVNYSSLGIYKSNVTFENCSFFNNTNYSMFALESILYLIKLNFYNNTSTEYTDLIFAKFSHVTLLKLEITSTNSYGSLMYLEVCNIKVIDSALISNTANNLITLASDSENLPADEIKTKVSSLIILNTTISGNYIEEDIVHGNIKGVFKILYCLIQNNTYSGEDNFGVIFFS